MWPFTRKSECATCGDDYTSSYPRHDWSGDPRTRSKRLAPGAVGGGDLPPFHPWMSMSLDERAARWAAGERPAGVESADDADARLRGEGIFLISTEDGFAWIAKIVADALARDASAPPPRPSFVTSGFFYDSDLAKFGNAVSPFVEMSSRDAHLAEQRRFEDRYDPRYFQDFGDTFVGWAQPPHPIDVVPSFDPLASGRDQARAVLMDYYHDDPLRYWADNEAVKRCFGVKAKEDYDPALLVEAYENKNHKVWSCKGDKNTWKDMDDAVRAAIAHRTKLGPLPASSYDSDPIVIYYYDNDRMKRISYPRASVPSALNPNNVWWWKWGQGPSDDASKKKGLDDIHTNESNDPKAIAAERAAPGYPGGGNWGSEGVTWDKDMIGVMGPIVGAVLAIVSAILDMTGVGAVVGVPLAIATPFIVAAINAADTALHAGDFGAALQNLGPALIQAAANAVSKGSGVQIPPEATKALGATVTAIGNAIAAGQKKNLDFGELWERVNKKAASFTKVGDAEAHTIAVMLGENAAGNVFIHGYEAGKLTDAKTIAAIAKIMEAMKQFSDPRIINIFLLGAGIGSLAKEQTKQGAAAAPAAPSKKTAHKRVSRKMTPHSHVTQGDFVNPQDQLAAFVSEYLDDRYGLEHDVVHVSGPPSNPLVVAIQTLLNELWGFVHGQWGYIPITGVLTARTKELIASFQQSYNVAPGDGTPNNETVKALEAAVDDKRALQQHAVHATSGSMFVMDASGTCHTVGMETEPDWGALSRGCPKGMWWDSLTGQCRPIVPPPPHPIASGDFERPRLDPETLQTLTDLANGETPDQRRDRQAQARAHTQHAYDDYVRRHGHVPTGGIIPSAEDEAALAWRKANGVDFFGLPLSSYTSSRDRSDMGDVMLGAPTGPEIVRWYAARTEGSARDLADSIASAPHVHLAGEYPTWTITLSGLARFKLIHDAEGGIRVHLLDVAPGRSFDEAWRQIETLIRSS